MGKPESTSDRVFCRRSLCGLQGVAAGIAVTFGLLAGFVPSAIAGSPLVPIVTRSNALEATTSDAARRDAIRSIPFGKLSADDRAKVGAVSGQRQRLPADADPSDRLRPGVSTCFSSVIPTLSSIYGRCSRSAG